MFSSRFNKVLLASVTLCCAATAPHAFADQREVVSFRLPQWKSAHFDDQRTAIANFETLKKLGCEAVQHQHGGHVDVRYRCQQWRSIVVNDHTTAHQWERWLKAFGFETVHKH